ncbi:MAG TPA: Hpt domain-containing protein, partial [Gammaproteobacteria bacterium]|nr:Hpt domain-containing protein [Gammaproteobacteria bacterium]
CMFGKDPGTFREIVREFVPAAQENVDKIRTGWSERSAEKIQAASHKLKSSARSVGAHDLAETVAALEAASRANDWRSIDEGVSSLGELMRDVEVFVDGLQ